MSEDFPGNNAASTGATAPGGIAATGFKIPRFSANPRSTISHAGLFLSDIDGFGFNQM
jgi:hypothetical protein